MIDTTVARPYAQAAFQYAQETHAIDQWESMLSELAQYVSHSEVKDFLKNPTYSADEHAEFCNKLVSHQLGDTQQNFIKILAEKNRLLVLPTIFNLFVALRLEAEKILPVTVKSAFPLDEEDLKKINTFLNRRFQQAVSLKTEVDKNLIGGVLIHAGGQIIDNSVRGQLDRLKSAAVA